MPRRAVLFMILILFSAAACTTTLPLTKEEESILTGAGVGAAAGSLIDKKNRWRGAVIGAALGGTLTRIQYELARQAAIKAAQTGRTVRTVSGSTVVEATPLSTNGQTNCRKVRRRVYDQGKLIEDRIEEICESTKIEQRY